MNQTLMLGLLRHALQLAAGFAVARGWIADSDVETVIGALLSIATIIWYAVERHRAGQDAKVVAAVQGMGVAIKGAADAMQIAAVAEPTDALREAAAAVPGARAAIDRATNTVLRQTSGPEGRGA